MRISRLEMRGFGPYLDAQTVDFAAFDAEGLFVISGKTGAGKSTILDACVFALYNRVPRYDGTEKSVRSHFCGEDDPTEVALEYELGTERYRVWRSPDYPRAKKRGTGTTTKTAEAKIYRWDGSDWEILAARPTDVANVIAATLPLTADQFLQVVLLAQGRFAEFLQADTSERRTVLRSLFDTVRFERLEQHVRDLARERSRDVEAADASLAELVSRAARSAGMEEAAPPDVAEFWERTADALAGAATEAARVRGEAAAAALQAFNALTGARSTEDARARLARARETVTTLEDRAEEHAADVARLERARAAVPVVAPLNAAREAAADAEAAVMERERVLEVAVVNPAVGRAWPEDRAAAHGPLSEADESALRARADELAGEVGALKGALDAERSLAALQATRDDALEGVEAAQAAEAATVAELAEAPATRERLDAALAESSARAARADDLKAPLERAEKALEAHGEVAALEVELRAAQTDEVTAADAHADAAAAHAALVRRRLASQAAHLAAALKEGQPCPVCGSAEHPSPAEPSDEHATDAEVDDAATVTEAAKADLDRASLAVTEVKGRLALASERAGDADAESAQAAVVEARTEHEAAMDAAAVRDRVSEELAALKESEASLAARLERERAAVQSARTALTEAAKAAADAETLAADVPEGYASVADFAQALRDAKAIVDRLAAAAATAAAATLAAAKADAALAEALEASAFESATAAAEAALSPGDLSEVERAVENHRSALASARGVVAELSSADLPEEVADLEALEAASNEAASARDAAIAAERSTQDAHRQFAAMRTEYAERAASTREQRALRDVALTLADSLEGKAPNDRKLRLESFVLASKLERIVAAANARLLTMSSGQYQLEHDDQTQYRNKETGLGLRIADAHTGQSRSTRSLSGGETFLTSLALALGLAETVTAEAGGIRLDTLFIDEGFGSLDGDTLEIAMSTLTGLRDSGRTVGVISHVDAMKDEIPAKLEVVKKADGSSAIASNATGGGQ